MALGAFAALAIALTIMGLRRDAFAAAAREQADLAIVLGQQISASNRDIDAVLDHVSAIIKQANPQNQVDFRRALSTPEIARRLRNEIDSTANVYVVTIIDDSGDYISTSRAYPAPNVNVAHEDDFVMLSANNSAETYISKPEHGRLSDNTIIYYSRKISSSVGTFLGIIHVGMTSKQYYSIYAAISALKDKAILLARRDGVILVRFPELPGGAPERMRKESPWRETVAAGGGVYLSPGYFDGIPRLVAVHPLDDCPLVVDVSASEAAILEIWRARAAEIGFGALLAFLCAGLLMRATFGHLRRMIASEAASARKERELESVNARFALVLGNLPQGVALYESDLTLIVANERYGEMYELSPEDVKSGTPLEEIFRKRVARGYFSGDPETYVKRALSPGSAPPPPQTLDRLSNGRVVMVTRRPMSGGGWLVVHEDVTDRQLADDRVEYLALHDQLTGAANRVLLLRTMTRMLSGVGADGHSLDILLLDLDEFKVVNDTRGHPFGDALLRAVVERLCDAAGERNLVARIGGDEFAILHGRAHKESEALASLAQRILESIRAPFEIDGFFVSVSPSIGIASAPQHGSDVETLMKNADLALYRAKNEGRDRVCCFDPSMEGDIREQRLMKADLAEAVASRQFEVHYQPIVETRSRRVVDVEALVRWRHPSRGMIRPDHFIKLAEQTGQIHAIGEIVLRTACADAARWPESIGVSVNLSAAQFGRGDLVALVSCSLAESGLAPARLTLEVTETALMENIGSSREVLAAIRDLGVRISLDDFGTGYSSLSYLQAFPLDCIKIDRSFVAAMETNTRTQEIVALIAAIARRLGARTVAEGIETRAQFELVRAAGCDAAQGYLFSRPKPIGELSLVEDAGDPAQMVA